MQRETIPTAPIYAQPVAVRNKSNFSCAVLNSVTKTAEKNKVTIHHSLMENKKAHKTMQPHATLRIKYYSMQWKLEFKNTLREAKPNQAQ